jgi:hypothetical protein
MLAHLRTEAYPVYRCHRYPAAAASPGDERSYADNVARIDASKRTLP